MAGNCVILGRLFHDGRLYRTPLRGKRTPWVEPTSRRRIYRRRYFSGKDILLTLIVRVAGKSGREKGFRVWVKRVLIEFISGGVLHDLAQVHHRRLVGEIADCREVVRYK